MSDLTGLVHNKNINVAMVMELFHIQWIGIRLPVHENCHDQVFYVQIVPKYSVINESVEHFGCDFKEQT